MFGEVVKWIISIANWFIKPRLQIKPPQIPEEEEPTLPQTPQTPRWSKKTQQFWSDKLGKNPAYKSSNGF